jgi:hypothetical protein
LKNFYILTQPALETPAAQTDALQKLASGDVVWCGFDENLEQGARCKRQLTNQLNPRVFA